MNLSPFAATQSLAPLPFLPAAPPRSSAFWKVGNVADRLQDLRYTMKLAESMKKELEILIVLKNEIIENNCSNDHSSLQFSEYLNNRGIDLESQELVTVNVANALISELTQQLEPFRQAVDEEVPWEEKSSVVRFSERRRKSERNKRWRKRKKQRVAESLAKEEERFANADKEADEWMNREIAKEAAKQKVEKMKLIAKVKAKEERKKLESELEKVMMVEKLRELRSIRIEKLKKQGHFLPDEDDRFVNRVRESVEEEERLALLSSPKNAILNAEESHKESQSDCDQCENVNSRESEEAGSNPIGQAAKLPSEFYHYYYGSNNDMGTLIEVRRTWDAYIRRGGSRIPGHWVQPPTPSSEAWASYIIAPTKIEDIKTSVN